MDHPLNSFKINLKKCELLYLACEAAVTTLIDLFILGVDAETIETTLEVHTRNLLPSFYLKLIQMSITYLKMNYFKPLSFIVNDLLC